VADDEGGGDAAEVEALAAGEDGGEDLFGVSGGEEELHMGWGFLEGFQQGIEGRDGQHVDFVDDVDLELCIGGSEPDGIAEFADLFDAIVGSAVDFEDIE
jgi:hypothetical protein